MEEERLPCLQRRSNFSAKVESDAWRWANLEVSYLGKVSRILKNFGERVIPTRNVAMERNLTLKREHLRDSSLASSEPPAAVRNENLREFLATSWLGGALADADNGDHPDHNDKEIS